MPWFKVDDTLAFHAKTVAAGNAAMGLWVRAGSWSSQTLTEGGIPNHMFPALGTVAQAERLVRVGLWDKTENGYRFHEWDQRNPTKSAVEAEREASRERQRKAREKSRLARSEQGVTDVSRRESRACHAVSHGPPDPTRPDPSRPLVVGSPFRGEGTSVTRDVRPPSKCKTHAHDDDPPPCGKCADARRAADAWQPPTLSAKTTMCGDHPQHPALHCPICASQVTPPPADWRTTA